ncbi:LPXTG cell wall anchor domain-containing protein [Streptomyces thermoalcalitolerans]|uniref:Gram-positive cocci surface proteins LPxTG domain-containing protein n=1 Tax=Streptomyces thermoalcalitolerans TaxID=65605 RepID=A0ABP4A0X5_9ACTN
MHHPARIGVLAAVCSLALFTAPAAHATPPGDNGTVKIHDASTGEELRRNEPHVCTFYLDAFGFDGGQRVDWRIERWAPAAGGKGETVLSDSLVLDASGHGRSEDLSLPDGHYKLFWSFDGQKGSAKHKVFWTDCEDSGDSGDSGGSGDSEGGGTTPSGTPSASVTPSAEPSEPSEPSGSSGASPSATSPAAVPGASPSAQGTTGDLADTGNGVPVGLLSGAAAALVAVGGFLLFRRRGAVRD